MPIKKSSLEQKWYFRVIKALLLLLPLLFALIVFLNGKANFCGVLQNKILDLSLQKIIYILIWLVLYYLGLTVIWRLFLYIVFGGLEDDTQQKGSGQPTPEATKRSKIARIIPFIIALIFIAVAFLSAMGYIKLPKINLGFFGYKDIQLTPGPACYVTSAQMGTPCHSVKNGVGVSGVIVPGVCKCPSDTDFAQKDNITAGGPYNICKCR
jgi:hypothetical protein